MANLILYTHSFDTTPYSFPCYDLDFALAMQYPAATASNLQISNNKHAATTGDDNYYGFSFACKPIWNITDPETQETVQYNLLENDLPAPFLPFPAWKQTTAEDGYMEWDGSLTQVSITPTMLEPDDWQDNFLSYYTRSKGAGMASYTYSPNNQSDWISFRDAAVQDGRTVWKSNIATGLEFMVQGGLFPFSFRIRNYIGSHTYGTASAHANACISGMSPGGYNSSVGFWSSATTANSNSFTNIGTPGYLYNSASWGTSGDKSLNIQNAGSLRAQTYPVCFEVGANTSIGGMVVSKKTSFYGIMTVTFSAYGIPNNICCSVLSKNMWNVKSGAGNSAGADSLPSGGNGKQKKGGYNPQKTITKNTNGGLLTNPTTAAGFVIYQFTPAEFTQFLSKVYSETALPGVGSAIGGIASEIGAADSIYQAIASYFNKGWSNTENIVFVKTSPVNFPTQIYNLSKLSIGALGISSISARVVQSYIVDGTAALGSIGSDPEWFTDVEPYASASIFFPLAGSVAVPPSVLAGSSCSLRYAFNLLNNGCGYSMHILKGGNYLHLAKNGECAKSADCVIPGRDISGTVSQLGALAATGIATLATGGTAAPSLVTTALGAATTAVHEATDLSISNMPPCSSGSPYDDTVNGGLRDVVLYRTKAERYTSGEGTTNYSSGIIGTFSYQYISGLDQLAAGSFVSVLDLKLPEAAGMTKAEHDRICALLSEGAWI